MSDPPPFLYEPKNLRSSTAVVHLEYDPEKLEPAPGPSWTRFVCISDTHARAFDVPDGDVLLHSGDLTNSGMLNEFGATMDWLCRLPHKVKIIIAGNHDLTLHHEWYETNWPKWHRNVGKQPAPAIRDLLKGERAVAAGVVYLQDEQHRFQVKEGGRSWSVYGSPWSPWFFDWAFNYERQDGPDLVSKFPKTDILLTHGPAFGILDLTNRGDPVGCDALLKRLPELRPRIHVAGHIHEARGGHVHDWVRDGSGNFAVPGHNNDETDSDDEGGEGGDVVSLEGEGDIRDVDGRSNSFPSLTLNSQVERTVFVNAANSPAGRHTWRTTTASDHGKRRVPFGGPGFQAVVVDLRDDIL